MFKKYTKSLNQNIYLNSAVELGCEIEVIEEDFGYSKIRKNGRELLVFKNILDTESVVPAKVADNKYLSNFLLVKDFPQFFPPTKLFHTFKQGVIEELFDFVEHCKYEVVIKPNCLSSGKGVCVLPKNREEVARALEVIKSLGSVHFIVQNFLHGLFEYRIVLLDNEVHDILLRKPANITGDGEHTISELIEKKNLVREKHGFKIIVPDQNLEHTLTQKGLNMQTKLPSGEYLQLRRACNFAQGGEVVRIDLKEIDTRYLDIFKKIAFKSGLHLIGLDYMGDDLSRDFREDSFGFNEINSYPMPDIHYFADLEEGHPLKSTKDLLSKILDLAG